ncbi:hypothetical protein GM921_09625 [Pedobacter sp. LMG 31464]|uniref:Type I restriction modification DNA specificity domain-containing protein n=1 Tax=Pedobacter planticolens TaxID=2679964 RepID=A0A923E006_9SPHI|nr:restriction endonuclease subunit S [Pedobacter planticolens]MBB2145745.1 hypothetical protein [Pedobacter planticolens]
MEETRKNKSNVPNLRFHGFDGEWELDRLENLDIKIIDGDRGKNYPNGGDFSDEGYCLFLNAKNVTKLGFSFSEKSFITKQKDESLRKGKLMRSDLVLTTRGSIGHVCYYDASIPFENLRINSGMVLIRCGQNKVQSEYLYKYFNSKQLQNIISMVSFGSAQPQLTVSEISKFMISFPQINEQNKIASFISLIDERIETQSKIIKNLESQMRLLRDSIFSRTYRFKSIKGIDVQQWRTEKLKDLSQKCIFKNKDSKITSVFTNSAVQGIVNQRDFFERDIANKNNISGYYIVERNDFVYNPRISKEAPVGPISRNKIGTGIMSPLYTVFRFFNENVDFIEQFFKTEIWHRHMAEIANFGARSDRMGFSSHDFFEMPIVLPEINEQELIAKFLTLINDKIEVEKKTLAMYSSQKEFLIRNLFI